MLRSTLSLARAAACGGALASKGTAVWGLADLAAVWGVAYAGARVSGCSGGCSSTMGLATSAAARAKEEFFGYAVLAKGETLKPWTYEPKPLADDEIDIDVTHNGVCHTDLHMKDNDWSITTYPLIAGHEVVGKVKRLGASVKGLAVGDRVGFGWIRGSCRRCRHCIRGDENVCDHGYEGTILAGNHGGFQRTMRAPADFAYKIPDALDSASAAPLLCAGVTVYAPLRKWVHRPGTRVGVLGVGGLGHLAIQFAAKMGAEVTGMDVHADKEEEAKGFGASHFLNPITDAAKAKAQFDVIINCASGNVPAAPVMAMLGTDGVLVQVGLPADNPNIEAPLYDLVFSQKAVAGSIVGGRADMLEMLEFAALHGIKPLVEEMPLSQINEAFARVASGKARYRVVLTTDG